MGKLFLLCCITFLAGKKIVAQDKIAEIPCKNGFSASDEANGYFIPGTANLIVAEQIGHTLHRTLYDSGFNAQSTYTVEANRYTFKKNHPNLPKFAMELPLKNYYEVYSSGIKVIITKLDFEKKQDSIVFTMDFPKPTLDLSLTFSFSSKEERLLAVFPYSQGLRVLTYSQKKDKLILYQWNESGNTDTIAFDLPASSLSPAETAKYSKDAQVK